MELEEPEFFTDYLCHVLLVRMLKLIRFSMEHIVDFGYDTAGPAELYFRSKLALPNCLHFHLLHAMMMILKTSDFNCWHMQYVCTNRAVLAAIGTNLPSCHLLCAAKTTDEKSTQHAFALTDVWLCCDRLTAPKYLMCIFITCGGRTVTHL